MNDNKPVLKGYIKNNFIYVWCPNCSKWHIHGVTPEIQEGFKSARSGHCIVVNASFEEKGGYFIQRFNRKEMNELRTFIKSCR